MLLLKFSQVQSSGSCDPLRRSERTYLLRSCLGDAKKMLLFLVEQVFLLMGKSGWYMMQILNAQWKGERRPMGREILCLNFSYLAIKYKFYFTIDTIILNKLSSNWIQHHIKKIIHHDQVGFVHGMKMSQHTQINQCDTHIERWKLNKHLKICIESIWQNITSFYD